MMFPGRAEIVAGGRRPFPPPGPPQANCARFLPASVVGCSRPYRLEWCPPAPTHARSRHSASRRRFRPRPSARPAAACPELKESQPAAPPLPRWIVFFEPFCLFVVVSALAWPRRYPHAGRAAIVRAPPDPQSPLLRTQQPRAGHTRHTSVTATRPLLPALSHQGMLAVITSMTMLRAAATQDAWRARPPRLSPRLVSSRPRCTCLSTG